MSATGSRIVVGAPAANSVNGTVHVWDWNGTTWTALGTPIADDHELGDDVDISDDGNRIAIGAPSAQGAQYPGEVQVYEWNGTAWTALGALIVGSAPSQGTGDSLSLSGDGTMLAIGASGADINATNTGMVRVFRWNATEWTQVGDPLVGPANSGLGTSVAISADGTRVIAGGPSGGGAARLFTLANDAWTESPARFGSGDRTGTAVSISADGTHAAVGAPYANPAGSTSGEVRIYDLP
jgi:WD40 repeat protein